MLGSAVLSLPSHRWWTMEFLPWLEPVATCVGVVAAIVAGTYAARVYRIERARDEEAATATAANQASRVAAWVEQHQEAKSSTFSSTWWECKVINTSGLPVYAGFLMFRHNDTPVGRRDLRVIPPSGEAVTIEIADVTEAVFRRRQQGFRNDSEGVLMATPAVTFYFRDLAGRRWKRDEQGRLSREADHTEN